MNYNHGIVTTTERELVETFLECLDDTCFPGQIDWNNRALYIKGITEALKAGRIHLVKYELTESRS